MRTVVEIFKTNVQEQLHAQALLRLLHLNLPNHRMNFDLDDCDKILRVEGKEVEPEKILHLVSETGFTCTRLS